MPSSPIAWRMAEARGVDHEEVRVLVLVAEHAARVDECGELHAQAPQPLAERQQLQVAAHQAEH